MQLLDLFCGAGGASEGYHRAGFQVVGVDNRPQPHYPYRLIVADALDYVAAHGSAYDAIHASPPCQRWSQRGLVWKRWHPDLITPLRALLRHTGRLWMIENVCSAPLCEPIVLCGTMFGLRVFRHRAFECSFHLVAPPHPIHRHRIGDGYYTVTGHSGGHHVKKSGSRLVDGGTGADWREAMGIAWMTNAELVESIPPAYTHYIGLSVLDALACRKKDLP